MKYIYILLLTILFPATHFAQIKQGFALSFGANSSYTAFKAFENYTGTYNAANMNRPGFEALKYNPFGFGMEGEAEYLLGGFYTGFRLSGYNSLKSESSLAEGVRVFQFKSLCTDLKAGFMVKGFSMYLAMGIHSFNLLTHFRYGDGTESYGDEKYISGVYTSFKMQGILGMRYEKRFDKLGFYLDVCAPLNAKHQNGGSFLRHKANSDEIGFPQDHSEYFSPDAAFLPQVYRNFRGGAGLVFYFSKND